MRSLPLFVLAIFAFLAAAGRAQDHLIFLRNLRVEEGQKGKFVPTPSLPPSYLLFPPYPGELLRAGVMGEATLRFFVRENGSVGDVSIVAASLPEFGEAAKDAVTKWKYREDVVSYGGPNQTATNVWMRCRFVFKLGEDDGVPGYYPGLAYARMNGREVLALALAAGEKEKIDLKEYSAPRAPRIAVWGWEGGLMWTVFWDKKTPTGGELIRVWIDDKTRETKLGGETWFGDGPDATRRSFGAWAAFAPIVPNGELDLMILLYPPTAEEVQNEPISARSLPFPAYAGEMIHAGLASGEATVRFLVGADGAVTEASVVAESTPGFDTAAKEAVGQWKFERKSANQAAPGIWMRGRFVFALGGLEFGGGGAAFADTSLSGHEAFVLAFARAKTATAALKDYSPANPEVRITQSGERLIWTFTWLSGKSRHDFTRVSIDDKTRETSLETGQVTGRGK